MSSVKVIIKLLSSLTRTSRSSRTCLFQPTTAKTGAQRAIVPLTMQLAAKFVVHFRRPFGMIKSRVAKYAEV